MLHTAEQRRIAAAILTLGLLASCGGGSQWIR